MLVLTVLCVAAFVAAHLFVGKLRFLAGIPRSRWLSMAGGVAVAYVFLHILPELGTQQTKVGEELEEGNVGVLEHEIYLAAFLGLATFYGLERLVRGARHRTVKGDQPERPVFWLHVGSFALYNLLVGYLLLHREEAGLWPLLFYGIAMALHFVTNDFGLREDYKDTYDRTVRWILAAAVTLGWILGWTLELSEIAIGLLFAFLSGGIVLNVLKEELPEERQSRFLPFAVGAGAFAVLLLLAAA